MKVMIQKQDINMEHWEKVSAYEKGAMWEAVATDTISHLQGCSHRSQSVV